MSPLEEFRPRRRPRLQSFQQARCQPLIWPRRLHRLWRILRRLERPVEYHLIDSDYGHDSFLVEPEKFTPRVVEFLARMAA